MPVSDSPSQWSSVKPAGSSLDDTYRAIVVAVVAGPAPPAAPLTEGGRGCGWGTCVSVWSVGDVGTGGR